MKDNNIVVLHVFLDSLIFKGIADSFDSMQGVRNLYIFYTPIKGYRMQSNKDKRVIVTNDFESYTSYFHSPEVDVIFFHSLPYSNYYLFDYIDNTKFVIWWAWGHDLYYKQGRYLPLLTQKEMLKPLTKEFVHHYVNPETVTPTEKIISFFKKNSARVKYVLYKVIHYEKTYKPKKNQDEILERIDAFYAPLDIEYEMMKQAHHCFSARGDMKLGGPAIPNFEYKEKIGNILVNHSLTETDNHLDVFEYLYKVKLGEDRKYILPVSYGIGGNYNGNPDLLINACQLNSRLTCWLKETMPFEDYKRIINTISHAVFGMIRQQALGNVFMCLQTGVKVYLFRNSIIYQELKKAGFICFSIEDDLTTDSLATCLTRDEAKINFDLFMKRKMGRFPTVFRKKMIQAVEFKRKI